MTRDQLRQLEVWWIMRPYQAVDFAEAAYQAGVWERAARRSDYLETKLLDPWAHQRFLEEQAAGTRRRLGLSPASYRRRSELRERDVIQIRQMHAGGATLAAISRAFRISRTTASRLVRGKSFAAVDGPTRRLLPRGARVPRGAAHCRAKLTPELVCQVLAMAGTLRAIGAAVGLDKRTVAKIRSGETWLQRERAGACHA